MFILKGSTICQVFLFFFLMESDIPQQSVCAKVWIYNVFSLFAVFFPTYWIWTLAVLNLDD